MITTRLSFEQVCETGEMSLDDFKPCVTRPIYPLRLESALSQLFNPAQPQSALALSAFALVAACAAKPLGCAVAKQMGSIGLAGFMNHGAPPGAGLS